MQSVHDPLQRGHVRATVLLYGAADGCLHHGWGEADCRPRRRVPRGSRRTCGRQGGTHPRGAAAARGEDPVDRKLRLVVAESQRHSRSHEVCTIMW